MAPPTTRLVKVLFSCLMCGLDTPSVRLRIDELSRAAVRRALDALEEPGFRPKWDESPTPFCPRCRGRLVLELGAVPVARQLEATRQATP